MRFLNPIELPEEVAELFALTKYHVEYAAPRFDLRGVRVRGTGGYKIFSRDGAAVSGVIPVDAPVEEWREALGKVLDADIKLKYLIETEGAIALLFRDPKEK